MAAYSSLFTWWIYRSKTADDDEEENKEGRVQMIPEGDWGWNWAMMGKGKEEMGEELVFGLLFHVHIFFPSIGRTSYYTIDSRSLSVSCLHCHFLLSHTPLPYAMNKQTFLLIIWRIIGRRGRHGECIMIWKMMIRKRGRAGGSQSEERDESFHWNRLGDDWVSWVGTRRGKEIIRTPVQGNISSFFSYRCLVKYLKQLFPVSFPTLGQHSAAEIFRLLKFFTSTRFSKSLDSPDFEASDII